MTEWTQHIVLISFSFSARDSSWINELHHFTKTVVRIEIFFEYFYWFFIFVFFAPIYICSFFLGKCGITYFWLSYDDD